MKLVFLGSYLNHHQRPVCDALAGLCDFAYIATTPFNPARRALGWAPEQEPDYVCHYDRETERAQRLLEQAQVVLTGSAPEKLVRPCILRNQLVLRYAERALKNGPQWGKYLPRLVRWHYRNPRGRKIYMLCASAYTASDYRRFGLFRGKCFRWGYFPAWKHYEAPQQLMAQKKPASLLWAGRYLDLKHPDDALWLAERLEEAGYDFTLTMIGTGPMEAQLHAMASAERVRFLGAMKPEAVRGYMESAELFLFTSDRREGWGVVLSEAMNSGCCAVANVAAGASPFLIKDGHNGVLYENREQLLEKVRALLDSADTRRRLGLEAYETVKGEWNPETAARRLLALSEALLSADRKSPFRTGPCSPVEES